MPRRLQREKLTVDEDRSIDLRMKIKVLWGTKIGEEDWQEQMITENSEAIEKAKAWAMANNFDRLRVSEVDLEQRPDWSKTVCSR
jgi:hypothetical protein